MLYAKLIGRIAFFTCENIAHIEFYLRGLLPKILAIYTIKTHTVGNIQVTYEYTNTMFTYDYIGAIYDGRRVINVKYTIFLFTFHFYMRVGHVFHTNGSGGECNE